MSNITITVSDLLGVAIKDGCDTSARILKLADLNASPLMPGETADARRHTIAKLGKRLAETFLALDEIMRTITEAMTQENDVTAGPVSSTPTPDNPDAN